MGNGMRETIFGGASTFSKMHCNYPDNMHEIACGSFGQGVTISGDRVLFDTVSALGARLLHFDDYGGMQSIPTIEESLLAEMLMHHFPFIEMVRYGCNGADATEGALRYARAHTGRPLVYSVGYHSCQSAFTFNTPPALGCINGLVQQFDTLNDLIVALSLLQDDHTVGAVIIEPVMLDLNVRVHLSQIRSVTRENGIVLIFDEIITGFRVPTRSISTWYGITPDLILLGKALGGGYPLSVIGGPLQIMDVPVFHSYTFAGLPKALHNAIDICSISDEKLMKFWVDSGRFMENFNRLHDELKLIGYATRCAWTGPDELKYTFWQEMFKRGIMFGPAFFPRISWTKEDYERIINESISVFNDIKLGNVKLECRMPEPIFRRNK
jgi:glutamate-1-semialdehyde 2,1-aminomutase